VNATTSPPRPSAAERPAALATPPRTPAGDSCPLCGAPLRSEQEWCLRCGAAARTRLAAAPNWKPPIAALAAVIALSLGVLAAALVKLAGDSSSSAASARTIVTTAPAASTPATPAPGAAVPGAAVPGATAPGAVSSKAATPTTASGATTPGAGTQGTSAPTTSASPSSSARSKATGQTQTRTGSSPYLNGLSGAGAIGERQLREIRERAQYRPTK
jgi:hypothetical protein